MSTCAALLILALSLVALTSACRYEEPPPFTEGRLFAGNIAVSAADLNDGREAYMRYCYACHGEKGDGKGPASHGYRPPPRDLTKGIYKFARIRSSDELPHDDDLFRIVRGGLHGTSMLPWDIPGEELDRVVQYVKTFAPQKWEKRSKRTGEPVKTLDLFEAPADPWLGRTALGIARGKELYHFRAECMNCHPAYDTRRSLYELSLEAAKRDPENFKAMSGMREDPYGAAAKDSPEYGVKILPPDFLHNPVRSVCTVGSPRCPSAGPETTKTQLEDLYRLISYGVYPVMPAWRDAGLTDEDIWALAHYVKSLMDLRDTNEGRALKERLETQAPFVFPAAAQQRAADEPAEKTPG